MRTVRRTAVRRESFLVPGDGARARGFVSRERTVWPDGFNRNPPRRGSMLLIAMVCLLVMMTVFGALLQMAHASRQQARRDVFRSQARWLAEAGASRAAAALGHDAAYTGETWTVSAATLGEGDARVKIVVQHEPATEIAVLAEYPADDPSPVRYEHTWAYRTGE
jgi:hypothetical protein